MTSWPVKTLGDLLEISIGGIWGSEVGEDEVDVFVYRSTELMKDGQLKEVLTVKRSITNKQLDSRKLEEGDLLLEKSGGGPKTPVGRVGLVRASSGVSVCSNFMQMMRPRKKDVFPVYLHYFLNHFHEAGYTEDLQSNSTGIRNLKTTEYMGLEIPVPPLAEQKRLVVLLDAATACITELTWCYGQARAHANNLFISAIGEVIEGNLDWPVRTLGEICEVFDDGDWIESKDQAPLGVRLIQTGNVGDGVFKDRLDKARFISESTFSRLRCTEIFPGDLLVSRLPDPVGRACLVPDIGSKMITVVDCTIMRPREDVMLPQLLILVTQTSSYREQVRSKITGTTRDRISRSNLAEVQIPVPPLEEQKRIVAGLDSIRAKTTEMVAAYEAKITEAKNLRKAILEAAFAGDL